MKTKNVAQPSGSSGLGIPDLDSLCFLHYFGILGIGDKNIKNIIVNLNVILNRFIVCAKEYDKYISTVRLNSRSGKTNDQKTKGHFCGVWPIGISGHSTLQRFDSRSMVTLDMISESLHFKLLILIFYSMR